MSHFLDRLTYFSQPTESYSDGHGVVNNEDRTWEDAYRARWAHDKIVRSTHGVNCTGSCSWKIYVKGVIVSWETLQTDYPRTLWYMPNHEPRGCARGASYSWYLYSANRVKYPMVRGRLLKVWREARRTMLPVEAWAAIVGDEAKKKSWLLLCGLGGFVRFCWVVVFVFFVVLFFFFFLRFASSDIRYAHASTGRRVRRASRHSLSRRPRTSGYFTRLAQ